jgi:hypothetical protein
MITELREAIATKLKTVATRVYYGSAPNLTYPYVIFNEVTSVRDRDSASKFLSVPVDISVFDQTTDGHSAIPSCETLTEQIRTVLEDSESTFSLTDHYVISVNYKFTRVLTYDDKVFQYVSEFDFELQKK